MADELEGSVGPAGVTVKASGTQVLPVLLAVLIGAWIWFCVIYVQDARSAERAKVRIAETQKLTAALKEQTDAIKAQERTGRTIVYVLTLPQAKRETLRLTEPEQLQELRRRDR